MNKLVLIAAIGFVFSNGFASAAAITGTIVDDATGMQVAKSEVRVFGSRFPSIDSVGAGTFAADDLAPGDYTVAVRSPGYVYTEMAVHVGPEAGPPLNFRLVKLGAIEGQLVGLQGWTASVLALTGSADGKTGKEVWKPVVDRGRRPILVDGDGRFQISDLPPGEYALLVAYSNSGVLRFPDGEGALELKGDGGTVKVRIPIPSGASRTIEGRIELPDSRDWYWVTLSNPEQPALAVVTAISDDKGAFVFRGIVPGAYDLLAAPGEGERGTRSNVPPYHGFARVAVDVRLHDARDVRMTPAQAIKVSVALAEVAMPESLGRCYSGLVTLLPLEDWGVSLERPLVAVKIGDEGGSSMPESIDGLAPARYGVSVENPGGACLVADNPVLDLTKAATGSVEAKMSEPGIVRGDADPGTEVILIPEAFAEGWSFLPAYWFNELPFDAQHYFRLQNLFGRSSGLHLPHVRIAAVDQDAHFEFLRVPAGGYRVAARSADPAAGYTDWQGMKRVEVPAAGVAKIGLATPK